MIIKNVTLVTKNKTIGNASLLIKDDKILEINPKNYDSSEEVIDGKNNILMPGFVDIHIHGSNNIDFMDAKSEDYKCISSSLYQEGVTSYLATTLTSDTKSLEFVAKQVKIAKKDNPSLLGIHLEGPYISPKFKGAQNEKFIRNPDIEELKKLQKMSGGNIRYISLAPEKENALEFIKEAKKIKVTCSAGHSDASFDDIENAIKVGLTNTTHTHNAMSGHHHRQPGVVTAAMYFDNLFCEVICDGIHVCSDTVKTFYKIIGSDRFIIITDALKIKNSSVDSFQLFGLDCIRKNGAAYLVSGPLAGSLLNFDQGLRNIKKWCDNVSLIDLYKISSYNAIKSLGIKKLGEIKKGYKADLVLLDKDLRVLMTFKEGKRVY